MTPRELKAKQLQELKNQKAKPLRKISNNFINNVLSKNNKNAIKTVYYLASVLNEFDFEKPMDTIKIDLRKMFKYTEMTAQEVRHNLKAMQETSITFVNEEEEIEEFISLVPRVKFHYGKNIVEIDLYSKIARLIIDVKNNYTFINTKELMQLNNKHSLRLLPLLHTISNYDIDIPKRKKMMLEELNEFFGTNYKTMSELERKILSPVKEELDNNSKISFIYEMNFISLGKGRPKIKDVTIDIIERKNYQPKLSM